MEDNDLSASLEDYLEAIYLISREKLVAHANHIADYLKVGKSSVSWALNQLAKKNLINYPPYEAITLTPKGKSLGRRLARRHREIKNFLTEVLAINESIADANACRIEHVLDNEVLQRMEQFMTFLDNCPRAGRQWMKGFGFFCDHGQDRQNCPQCVKECLQQVETAARIKPSEFDNEERPKISKPRDRDTLARLSDVLNESGRPLTKPQADVIDLFMNNEKHQTLDNLYQRSRNINPQVTRETVNQAIQILCEHKIARSLRFNEQTVYEHYHPESHHDHLFCVKCGAIVEFFDPRVEDLLIENARHADFRLLMHQLNIFGVCHDCIKQEAKTRTLDQCLTGEKVQIIRLLSDSRTQARLTDMGLTPDALIYVLNEKCTGNNMIVMVGPTRLMLDRDTATQVKIVTVASDQIKEIPARRRHRHRHAPDHMDIKISKN